MQYLLMNLNLEGAFAQFGPGRFKDLFRNMILPAGKNRIFFAGEALSLRHAWVEGALDSAWRSVAQFCLHSQLKDQYVELLREWGIGGECAPPPRSLASEDSSKSIPSSNSDSAIGTVSKEEINMEYLITNSLFFRYLAANAH
jgi:hypothetical protein